MTPTCPECRQGKHINCAGWAFTERDEFVPCMCPASECVPEVTP